MVGVRFRVRINGEKSFELIRCFETDLFLVNLRGVRGAKSWAIGLETVWFECCFDRLKPDCLSKDIRLGINPDWNPTRVDCFPM